LAAAPPSERALFIRRHVRHLAGDDFWPFIVLETLLATGVTAQNINTMSAVSRYYSG